MKLKIQDKQGTIFEELNVDDDDSGMIFFFNDKEDALKFKTIFRERKHNESVVVWGNPKLKILYNKAKVGIAELP